MPKNDRSGFLLIRPEKDEAEVKNFQFTCHIIVHKCSIGSDSTFAHCKVVNCPPVIACIGDLIWLAVGRYNYILYNLSLAVGTYRIA